MLIGLEASGHYWMSLWRFLLERDWQVEVFNPLLSSKSARTHLRGRKTDADDALFIARTVGDGDFIPLQPGGNDTEQLKLLCRQRRFVSHELANSKRRLTGLIDRIRLGKANYAMGDGIWDSPGHGKREWNEQNGSSAL